MPITTRRSWCGELLRPQQGNTDDPFSSPLFAPLFGPIPAGGKSKDWLESRGPG